MATTVANAPKKYTVNVKGFTYIKDFAFLTVNLEDKTERIILGSKSDFPIRDIMELKNANSVDLIERDPRTINGETYRQFRLESINF